MRWLHEDAGEGWNRPLNGRGVRDGSALDSSARGLEILLYPSLSLSISQLSIHQRATSISLSARQIQPAAFVRLAPILLLMALLTHMSKVSKGQASGCESWFRSADFCTSLPSSLGLCFPVFGRGDGVWQ